MNKLQLIKDKIVAAVPEIMELKFGCEIHREGANKREFFVGDFNDHMALVKIDEKGAWMPFELPKPPHSQIFTILGRPITLADVLRTIESTGNWPPYRIGTHGLFFVAKKVSATPDYISTGVVWDLSKDLSGQSEETIDFLYEILK